MDAKRSAFMGGAATASLVLLIVFAGIDVIAEAHPPEECACPEPVPCPVLVDPVPKVLLMVPDPTAKQEAIHAIQQAMEAAKAAGTD